MNNDNPEHCDSAYKVNYARSGFFLYSKILFFCDFPERRKNCQKNEAQNSEKFNKQSSFFYVYHK